VTVSRGLEHSSVAGTSLGAPREGGVRQPATLVSLSMKSLEVVDPYIKIVDGLVLGAPIAFFQASLARTESALMTKTFSGVVEQKNGYGKSMTRALGQP